MTNEKRGGTFVYPPLSEELANSITHGLGSAFGVLGCVLLVLRAVPHGALAVVSASLYGASLILLYLASCLYHALPPSRAKGVFRILDHCSIFVLILGTYIPVSFMLLGGALGWTVFGIIAAAAALGITLNAVNMKKFNRFSQLLYLVAGWAIILTLPVLFEKYQAEAIRLLICGGVLYTLGTYFFHHDKFRFYHAVWHLFVMGGSVFHFLLIYQYCFPA